MQRRQRLRRVGILCCHFLRNLAFYQAGWQDRRLKRDDPFWVTANGNFLDLCVLEWCKLFADRNGKHFWRKVITDQNAFFNELLISLNITEVEFDGYAITIRDYRDKFVAHLDSDEVMHIPKLMLARKSVLFLFDYVRANEDDGDFFHDAPTKASSYYAICIKQGNAAYQE